ncbi:ATP-binding protein [Streptomyces sp. NPDC001508]|uniref:sensor histidine kinase n=1 Tax=Streptomyces sp. NPDC001508 TaxID=3154656 RepID=UPI00331E888D
MPETPPYAVSSEPGRVTAPPSTRNRHARPPTQDAPTDSAIRSRRSPVVRLAVLPAALMALLAAAVVLFVLRSQEGTADAATWGVLTAAAVLGCGVLAGAGYAGGAESRSVSRQYESLRRAVAAGQADLQDVLRRLEQGEQVEQQPFTHQAPPRGDALGRLAYEINVSMWQARTAVARTAQFSRTSSPDSEEKVEVFVNLARRLQSLVHRAINMLDQLENEVEDPELLKGLFHVDHLATRIRRHAENVAVLGGSVSRRQWTRPVTLTEVLRSSIAEVEHYSRVKLVPPIEGTLRGHAVADVIHLLAELVENATMFSEPHAQVLLRAQRVTAGLAVEVEDRGLGMPLQEQTRINTLLAEPDRIDLSKLLADGRIGLYVVSALARRHGIAVRLQSNIYGGVQAILVIPPGLIGDEEVEAPAEMPAQAHVPPAQLPQAQAPQAQLPPQTQVPQAQLPPQTQVPHAQAPQAQLPPQTQAPQAQLPPQTQVPQTQAPQAQLPQARVPGAQLPPTHRAAAQGHPAQVPSAQYQAAQAAPAQQPAQRQPLPQARTGSPAPAPVPAQPYARGAGAPPAPHEHASPHAQNDRPRLPQRRAQEHLVPELRNGPAPRRDDEQEVEHDPGLMASFQRGVSLADHEPDEPPTDSSR